MKNRIGEKTTTYQGCEIEIVAYRGANDIDVKFNDEHQSIVKNRQYGHFKKGNIKNPYVPSVLGVGYVGTGMYSPKIDGVKTKQYKTWFSMMNRCYNPKYHSSETYTKSYVCNEWHNFQVFAKWFDENYYEIDGHTMDLDKDILKKGNKIYSPDTCIFVSREINSLFTKNEKIRGNLPIGVSWHIRDKKYSSTCNNMITGKQEFLGYYEEVFEAFYTYKCRKEQIIKEVAELYKCEIPRVLYLALRTYIVDQED